MKIKYIISLSMVALIGASCWGAAGNDDQRAQRINDARPAELVTQQEAPDFFSEMPLEILENHILNRIPAAKLMIIALKRPKLYPSIRQIPQFIQLQQNMQGQMVMHVNDEQKVFFDAAQSNYPGAIDVIDYLAPYVNINAYDASSFTALMWAALKNNLEMVELLLANGTDSNAANKNGDTALIVAVFHKHLEMAELLLAKGADSNVKNKKGLTALMLAATNNNLEMTELLLANGADISVEFTKGYTALSFAESNLNHLWQRDPDYSNRTRTIIDLLTRYRSTKALIHKLSKQLNFYDWQ